MTGQSDSVRSAVVFWQYLEPVSRKVYNFILKSVNFTQDADDIYQDSVLKAFRYFPTFRREAKFEAWFFAIAHNELRRYFKGAGRAHWPLDPVATGAGAAATEPGSRRREDLVREVYRFAERLAPRQREVFFLFYDSGFSIAEISGITGLREGNIKFILNRARRHLRTIMGENDE